MKTTTVLLASGKRVSWFNISYVKVNKLPGKEGYRFSIFWKYKASIKEETFDSPMHDNEVNKYFARFGIVPFVDNIYINLASVLTIDEEPVHGPVEKTRVSIVFRDGFKIIKVLESTQWAWFKTSYV